MGARTGQKRNEMSEITISLDDARALAEGKLLDFGCDDANAAAIADNMTLAERDGCHSHGLFRLPGYLASLKSGKVNGRASPSIQQVSPGGLRCDGDNGFAPLSLDRSREPFIERATSQGIAALALTNTYHFAALWIEVEALAEQGLCALACTGSQPTLPPAGGRRPVYGTNPIAFAWPRPGKPPMVFDQASAVMARGEVMIAAREGKTLPPGAGIGPDGEPTCDPNEVLKGAQLPFGGYKGAAIALMVELFVGPLIGDHTSPESRAADNGDGGPATGGEFILAMAPGGIRGDEGWSAHAEKLFELILSEDGVRLPGDGRRRRREQVARDGVRQPAALIEKINGMQP